MAMGGDGQRKAKMAISNHMPFRNSTGSLSGTQGGTRQLGWLSSHPAREKLLKLLQRASYVVWSYDTPIGFVVPDDPESPDGWPYVQYVIEETYSTTTSHHQTLVRVGFDRYDDPAVEYTSERRRAENEDRNAARREARAAGMRGPASRSTEPSRLTGMGISDSESDQYYSNESLILDITGLFAKERR